MLLRLATQTRDRVIGHNVDPNAHVAQKRKNLSKILPRRESTEVCNRTDLQ